ncbi:putative ABC transport system permease protein [Methylobacter tundripaludum]|uniref:Putative ABC transport system permease protein n=1 Tax=Methylobacter tundripaludum TaxID=173365 RepID=A0A2S6HGY9_9GAMM|nr:ABC transporter permease [Methylobacter tundripaludum]PPK76738.1 putative ABC transport system permease protein [Methylobacter tundripaludum]
MSSVLNRASRNFLWRHPWQLALAIVGIALGVAVVISIDLAMESSLNAFDQAGKAFSGVATHRIIAGDGGLDEKLYRRLRVDEGIQKLSPVVNGYVFVSKQTDAGFNLIGIDPFIEKSFQSIWQIRKNENTSVELLTRLITEPNTALISEQTASRLGLNIEDDLTIDTDRGERRLKIIGLLSPNNAVSEQVLSRLIVTDIATAQEVLEMFGRLSSIEVLIDEYQPEAATISAYTPSLMIAKPVPDRLLAYTPSLSIIRKALPGNALLVSAESQSQAMREMTRAFSINLKALGLLSLLVGMFLIYNTMTFLVMQRRRLIGSLRSIGVTRRQIFKLIIGEALLLAAIGTLIGIVLGIALGQGLLYLISGTINAIYFRIDAASLMITPLQIGKGALLGITATLLAVLPPAIEATRISPVTVLVRSQLESGIRRLIKAANLISGVFILGGMALALLSGKSIALGLASIFLLLFGFAMMTPALTLMFMKLIERVFGRLSGVLVRLPARMVSAEISRTGIAIAALMIAVSATIGMDLMIGSFRQTVADWVQTSLRADLYVSLPGEKMPGARAEQDQRLKAKLAELQGVKILSSVLHTDIVTAKEGVSAGAAAEIDFTKAAVFELNEKSRPGFIFKHKTDNTLWNRFEQQQTVIVTEPYAYHQGVKIGDKIRLQTDQGSEPFEVIGIYADYSGDQGHLAMSRRNYRHYWPDLGYSGIGVYAKDGVDLQQLENQINKLLTGQQSVKSDQAIYKASMEVFEQIFTITETLRWLSAAIAFVGVFSALMALQFERTRQLGILRAIGVTSGQLAILITGETGLMGLVAGLIAIPVGYIVAYMLIFVIYQRSFGWTMAFHFNPGVIYQGLALALIAATLAGILPALKMAQTKPAEALRSE